MNTKILKEYEVPQFQIIGLAKDDVITTSGGTTSTSVYVDQGDFFE